MRTSSAKAKGRRAAARVKEMMLSHASHLEDADIRVTPSGVTGPDLQFSPLAMTAYPIAVECKNQESLSIWKALEQAESHKDKNQVPVLFFTRNFSGMYAALPAEDLIKLMGYNEDEEHS